MKGGWIVFTRAVVRGWRILRGGCARRSQWSDVGCACHSGGV